MVAVVVGVVVAETLTSCYTSMTTKKPMHYVQWDGCMFFRVVFAVVVAVVVVAYVVVAAVVGIVTAAAVVIAAAVVALPDF